MRYLESIDRCALETVSGGGAWDKVDWAMSKVPGLAWDEKSCPSRQAIVGGLIGLGQSGAQLAMLKKTGITAKGMWTQWAMGAANTAIGMSTATTYLDNCERRKAGK